ncbi:transposon Ty3-I Gag-Pol polyprotein [Trichonephila inaurata madagascariensis]|uniref:Transposon Ty3-I Gag-Pol polyprotein n=1 Tax=Trichonephila inaurata madagascariensis TaxID=2747483 RepID=A0A8X7CFV9_9ARAC|nr:transposon Ty3-I Gag-Pol polyprotein [Trichonephila inaurata madagascariensis]
MRLLSGFRANFYAHQNQAQILLLLWGDSGSQCSVLLPTTRHHGQHAVFVSKDLDTYSHVFLRTESLRKGLQPPYEGPNKIVDHTEKLFRILRHGKEVSVSIDRLKPAYIPKESEDFPVEVNLKEIVSLQPEEIQESEQEKP